MIKNPYLFLIDKCLEKLSHKYGTPFKYEIERQGFIYKFSLYQDSDPIFSKEIPVLEETDMIDYVHYEVARDFFIGSIERIFMQRENAKKIFPQDHAKLKEEQLKIIKGNW